MNKFKINDKVIVTEGEHSGEIGTVISVWHEEYLVKTDRCDIFTYEESSLRTACLGDEYLDDYEEYFDTDDYFSEMATIAFTNKINIAVNPERHTLNIPYFKVYDNGKVDASKKVARLHFKDSGIEIHNHDKLGKKPWIPSNDDIKNIRNILMQPDPTRDNLYTVWQVLCYEWNRINDLIPVNTTVKEYVSGKCDNLSFEDTRLKKAYVPSTQDIPDKWEYNPSKGRR